MGKQVGITLQGPRNLADIVSIHFKADLSEFWDDRTFLAHFLNPDARNVTEGGTVLPNGPTWGRFSEEWTMHFGFPVDNPGRLDEAALKTRMEELLKLPESVKIEYTYVSHWIVEKVLADKYRVGRVLVAGDAAHRR